MKKLFLILIFMLFSLCKEKITPYTVIGSAGSVGPALYVLSSKLPVAVSFPSEWDTISYKTVFVSVFDGTTPIDNALVKVGNETLTYNFSLKTYYKPVSGAEIPAPVTYIPNQTEIQITVDNTEMRTKIADPGKITNLTYEPSTPYIGDTLSITWDVSETPDSLFLLFRPDSGETKKDILPSSTNSYTIPLIDIGPGPAFLQVSALKFQTDITNTTPVSFLLSSESEIAPLEIQPH